MLHFITTSSSSKTDSCAVTSRQIESLPSPRMHVLHLLSLQILTYEVYSNRWHLITEVQSSPRTAKSTTEVSEDFIMVKWFFHPCSNHSYIMLYPLRIWSTVFTLLSCSSQDAMPTVGQNYCTCCSLNPAVSVKELISALFSPLPPTCPVLMCASFSAALSNIPIRGLSLAWVGRSAFPAATSQHCHSDRSCLSWCPQ